LQPKTREWIIDGFEQAFIQAGASDFESGVATLKKVVDRIVSAHDTVQSREHFAKVLDQLPEPTWLERRFLQGIFRYALQILLYGAKIFARDAEENISELPRGRPGLDAFAEVSRKELRGSTHKQAKMRTATQFNVSLSTVQRAWDDRGNRGEVDFRSVLKFLADERKPLDEPAPQPANSLRRYRPSQAGTE
jgi:hypothetical protein